MASLEEAYVLSSYASTSTSDAWQIAVTPLLYEEEPKSEVSAKSLGKQRTTNGRSVSVQTVQRSAVHLVDVRSLAIIALRTFLKFGLSGYSSRSKPRWRPSRCRPAPSLLQKLCLHRHQPPLTWPCRLLPPRAPFCLPGHAGRSQLFSMMDNTKSAAGQKKLRAAVQVQANLSSRLYL